MYDDVLAPFPGKVTARSVFLRWRTMDLITMLARRYLNIIKNNDLLDNKITDELDTLISIAYENHDGKEIRNNFWYKYFLPHNIKNKQGKLEDTFAYMFRHTQKRPRDVLTQMQSIINYSRKEESIFPRISAESIIKGIHNERTLLQILGDSLSPSQGISNYGTIATARSVFYKRNRIMAYKELKEFAKELYNLYNFTGTQDPYSFIQQLLKCGVIGIVDGTGRNENDPYIIAKFEYIIQGNLELADRFTYCVHPILGDAFNMITPKNGCVIYPKPESDEDILLENVILN
jgi:hypothetical protein